MVIWTKLSLLAVVIVGTVGLNCYVGEGNTTKAVTCGPSEECCSSEVYKKGAFDGHEWAERRACVHKSSCEGDNLKLVYADWEFSYCKKDNCNEQSRPSAKSGDGPSKCYNYDEASGTLGEETCLAEEKCCKRYEYHDAETNRTEVKFVGCSILSCDKGKYDTDDDSTVFTCNKTLCGRDDAADGERNSDGPNRCYTDGGYQRCASGDECCAYYNHINESGKLYRAGCSVQRCNESGAVEDGKEWSSCSLDLCTGPPTTSPPPAAKDFLAENLALIVASSVYLLLVVVVEGFLFWHLRRHFKVEEMAGPTEDNRELGQMQRKQEEEFGESNGPTHHVPGRRRPASTSPAPDKNTDDKAEGDSAKDKSAEDKSAEDKSAKEKSPPGKSPKGKPSKGKLAKGKPAKGKKPRGKTAEDKTSMETATEGD